MPHKELTSEILKTFYDVTMNLVMDSWNAFIKMRYFLSYNQEVVKLRQRKEFQYTTKKSWLVNI